MHIAFVLEKSTIKKAEYLRHFIYNAYYTLFYAKHCINGYFLCKSMYKYGLFIHFSMYMHLFIHAEK